MNPEDLKKILDDAELTAEQKQQAILDLHEADKKGIALKNAELIASEKKLKEAKEAVEAKLTENNAKIIELEKEMKKNNPEDRQKYYDAKIQELEAKHKTDLDKITSEMGKYKEAHVARIRDEAIAEGIKELKLIPAYKDAYIARVMQLNNFELVEIDDKAVFINKSNNKTIDAVMREFAHTAEGKAFIENQSTGGGATGVGGSSTGGAGTGGLSMSRDQFGALSPAAQMEYMSKGGKVVNPT